MMDKRKLYGAVDKSSAEQHIHKSNAIVHIVGKSITLHLVEPGLMAGRAGWLADEIQAKSKKFKACCRLKYWII